MYRFNYRLLALLALIAQLAFAQVRSGTIVGSVVDPSGAPVADAEVIVREVQTNATLNLKTNATGEFNAPYLGYGNYTVSVRKAGFKQANRTEIVLTTNQTVRVDIRLEVGAVESSVTITGTALELQTESSRVVNTVSEEVIKSIPNINNNPLNYATLTQGVVARQSMNQTQSAQSFGIGTEGRRAMSNFSVNGGNSFTNDIQLDGVSIQASAWNEVAILPNTEGIQEVKTNINNMSAEYGRSQGTVVFTTKSGTNEFHGSGQFRLRNEALNANTFSNNAQGFTRQPFKVQNYSATLGGPVWIPKLYNGKDKTFFFVSYEGMRFNQAVDYLRTVPTDLQKQGNFSQTFANVSGQFLPVQVFDPFNVAPVGTNQWRRVAFPNATIPANRINPVMRNLVNLFPTPNRTPQDPILNTNNFFNRATRSFERNSTNARFDHRLQKHSIYFTGGANLASIASPYGYGEGTRTYIQQGGFIGPINGDRNYYASVGDTWVISPTLVADIRVGLTRVAADNRAETFSDINFQNDFGIPNEFLGAQGLTNAFPELTQWGGGWSPISPLNQTAYLAKVERQTNWNIVYSVTKTAGRWTHKWGGEFRNYLSNYSDARGSFNLLAGNGLTSGNTLGPLANNIGNVTAERAGGGIATYLLGAGSIAAGENAVLMALSAKYLAFYQQSDWRVNNRLTVNLGLRWDIQPSPTERYNRLSSFSYRGTTQGTPGSLYFPGVTGDRHLYETPMRDLGPRIGLAYRLGDRTVVRSGFGVNFLPTNTGYYGGPYYYGNQNFAPIVRSQPNLQFGPNPQAAIINPYNRANEFIPVIGANPDAPQYYGAGGNEPRFDREDFNNSRVYQWNFFIERKLGNHYLVNVGYTGSKGSRLLMARFNINNDQLLPQQLLDTWRTQFIASNGNNPATVQVPNPFNPGGAIRYNGNLGNATMPLRDTIIPYPFFTGNLVGTFVGYSTYNALMASIQRSYSNGLLFNLHYTWSKSIDFSSPELQNNNYGENGGFSQAQADRRNYRNSYNLATNDIPHRFVGTLVYNLPFGKGRKYDLSNKFLNAIAGGWNVGSVLMLQSGQPRSGFGGCGGALNGLCDRVPGVDIEVPENLQRFYDSPNAADRTVTLPSGRQITVARFNYLKFNPDAFRGRTVTLPNGRVVPDVYWFGTSAQTYNDVRGLPFYNHNMSLQKDFNIFERITATFSAEATNLWNRAQFVSNANVGSGNVFTANNPARGQQIGMIQNENFGTWGMATFDPRQIELRLRIRF
ncbi:MAG: carboxypeptidase-like regulatory domain-containing protein [Bryobacter sp.]|nr:carboxypeptidase-like regulatory domain-containing protein [Bryobacter sp.]